MNRKPYKEECIFEVYRKGQLYRYIVRTTLNKERRYIGCFKTKEEAVEAYQQFKEKHGIVRP